MHTYPRSVACAALLVIGLFVLGSGTAFAEGAAGHGANSSGSAPTDACANGGTACDNDENARKPRHRGVLADVSARACAAVATVLSGAVVECGNGASVGGRRRRPAADDRAEPSTEPRARSRPTASPAKDPSDAPTHPSAAPTGRRDADLAGTSARGRARSADEDPGGRGAESVDDPFGGHAIAGASSDGPLQALNTASLYGLAAGVGFAACCAMASFARRLRG